MMTWILAFGLVQAPLPPSPPRIFQSVESCDSKDRTIVYFSEGTAWREEGVPKQEAWIGFFNPTSAAQTVSVRVFPEGLSNDGRAFVIPAWSRGSINPYDLFWTNLGKRRINFSTTIEFQTLGIGSLAIWDANYTKADYVPPTYGCKTLFFNPYDLPEGADA